jgi:ribosomal protein S28E/S33
VRPIGDEILARQLKGGYKFRVFVRHVMGPVRRMSLEILARQLKGGYKFRVFVRHVMGPVRRMSLEILARQIARYVRRLITTIFHGGPP